MNAWAAVSMVAFSCALLPLALGLANARRMRVPRAPRGPLPAASVLIPARDEAESIGAALDSILAQDGLDFEVVVVDDHSTDETDARVSAVADRDPRVRLVRAASLPAGWNGKQHACATAARAARHDILVFLDADVRLRRPDALARLVASLDELGCDLSSGVPRQRTGTWLEHAVIPLIPFVLHGFLPLGRARRSNAPAYAAGCGQLFVARRSAYERAGGHAAIRSSRHDGVTLPRAFRRAGARTDLFEATPLAECRMYESAREVWSGLLKNADEGMAQPAAIGPWTVLLGAGQVLPLPLLGAAALSPSAAAATALPWAAAALIASYGLRVMQAARHESSLLGALLHPVGVAALLAIQWHALWLTRAGRRVAWKGRTGHETG